MLMERGFRPGECPESFNLDAARGPGRDRAQYLDAGAEILTTNTFGGSPLKLRDYGLEARPSASTGWRSRSCGRVAGERAYVSGSVGPTGKCSKPYGDTAREEIWRASSARSASRKPGPT